MRRTVARVLAVLALWTAVCSQAGAFDAGAARQTVDGFHADIVAVLKQGGALGFDGRRASLRKLLLSRLDVPYILAVLMGKHGASMSAAERQVLAQTIVRFAVSRLADGFDAYDGQRFVIGQVSQLKSGRARVRAELVETDGDRLKLNYVVRPGDDGWRIVDLWFDGVSGVHMYKAEFRSLLSREPVAALIGELERRISKLEAENR